MAAPQPAAGILAALSAMHKVGDAMRRRAPTARALDRQRVAFYSSVWTSAAYACGAEIIDLGGYLLEIHTAGAGIRVRGNVTSLDDPVTLNLAGDKQLVYRLLECEGIPIPRHILCRASDFTAAWRFASAMDPPCVVKPARGTAGGSGVSTGAMSRLQLASAMASAGAHCSDVVVEEQIDGEEYRLLFLDGDLLDVVKRSSPAVIGDGRSTVRQLIARENRMRKQRGIAGGQRLVRSDGDLRRTLAVDGKSARSIPRLGETVRLKRVVSDNRADENESATGRLCDAIVRTGARAANAVGVRLAGVDIICADARVPLEDSGGVVLEVNTTPALYYHYVKRPGATDVASMILIRLSASQSDA